MKATPQTSPHRDAFTLVELLVVVAIIGILAAMLFPGLKQMYKRAQGATCISNLKQLAIAINTYAADNGNLLPPSVNTSLLNNDQMNASPFKDLTNYGIVPGSKVFFCPTMTNDEYGMRKKNPTADSNRISYNFHTEWYKESSNSPPIEVRSIAASTNGNRVILSDNIRRGGLTIPTFHDGKGVTVAFLDGSVRFINTEPAAEWYSGITTKYPGSTTSLDLNEMRNFSQKCQQLR